MQPEPVKIKSVKIKPVKIDTLKDVCVTRFEELIISGKLSPGQKLPPERELALQLGVSRPVVHEAIVDIAAKGLVSLKPRVGTIVNDYRREGSLALLNSLVNHHNGKLAPKLLEGLLELRILFETENARLAAINRTDEQAVELKQLVQQEVETAKEDIDTLTELDFQFHLLLAMATDNLCYPLLLNSFKQVYTNLTGIFFSMPSVITTVLALHKELSFAVEHRDEKNAVKSMKSLLAHGEKVLKEIITK
jgi:GntR family transcriptional regulator, transcriptional repressor for pyruvate dehydrogenase complex